LLRRVQEGANVTPMRERVTFVSVAAPDTPVGTWDDVNWRRMTPKSGTVADAEARFRTVSERDGEAPLIHVVAHGGRHAGVFHGAEFAHVNLILYVNEMTNAPPLPEPSLLDRIFGAFQ
jgi:hypothetical protein